MTNRVIFSKGLSKTATCKEYVMKNELIIFDFFGVCCGEIAPVWFAKRVPKEEIPALMEKYFVKADLGDVTMEQLFAEISADLNVPVPVIKAEWEPLFVLNYALFDYIARLKQQYTVILLSNAPLELLDDLLDKNDLRKYFDKIFISCHMKLVKPNLEIFRQCINSFPHKFDKVYMVDDNPKNLEHLTEINVTPIRFTGNDAVFAAFPLD